VHEYNLLPGVSLGNQPDGDGVIHHKTPDYLAKIAKQQGAGVAIASKNETRDEFRNGSGGPCIAELSREAPAIRPQVQQRSSQTTERLYVTQKPEHRFGNSL